MIATEGPLVSVSIPTYNSEAFLLRCLQAVKDQTYTNIEIDIIDSASKDSTLSIARSFDIEPIIFTDALLGARYAGLKAAKGEYILLLDSDQILEGDAIERAVKLIQSDSLDMLVLEEDVYKCETFIEKLFHYDRKLIHSVKDFSPFTGVMLPRFYKTDLLKKAFASISEEILKTVGGQDHAIIYFEAWNLSNKVNILPNAVKHIEPSNIKSIWKKFYRWGYTSVVARKNKYTELVSKKERFRKGLFHKGLYKESFASVLLLLFKGVPYKLGYYVARFKI